MSTTPRGSSEGIFASARPHGWAATRWMAIFDPLKKSHHGQLSRGRALARSGKVRELWFSPSLVGAYVADGREEHQVRLQFTPFDDGRWSKVFARLVEKLSRLADLLEGELPEGLAAMLEADGASLLPKRKEIEGACDCKDFHLPCAHMAAVHNLLADALDADPFLLITLRGLDRDQLLDRLRATWGDPRPLLPARPEDEAPPPVDVGSWLSSPEPLPTARVRIPTRVEPLAGIKALGPPPGGAELIQAIEMLYVAGAEAAADIAYADVKVPIRGATERWAGFQGGVRAPAALTGVVRKERSLALPATEVSLIARIVDALAAHGPTAATTLADRMGEARPIVARQLEALKVMGVVYRTGQARSTRWTLG